MGTDNNQHGEFYVALNELRTSIEEKIDRVDTRQREDIAKLESKNDKWQDEVRDEFSDVKQRLTVIETQVATRDSDKKGTWKTVGVVVAIVISILAIIFKAG
jgi:hypothetical protein